MTTNYNKNQVITRPTTSSMGGRQRYPPHPMGLRRQDMFEKGLFAGIKSARGTDNYPPVKIETRQHRTSSDGVTITTLAKSSVEQAMEARDVTKRKPEVRENKLTTHEHPCKHYHRTGQTYLHKYIKEETVL